jgi:hypothetical protein
MGANYCKGQPGTSPQNLREFLAPLDLAGNLRAVNAELRVLAHERGGGRLPAGVGINLRVSPREMDRSTSEHTNRQNYLTRRA